MTGAGGARPLQFKVISGSASSRSRRPPGRERRFSDLMPPELVTTAVLDDTLAGLSIRDPRAFRRTLNFPARVMVRVTSHGVEFSDALSTGQTGAGFWHLSVFDHQKGTVLVHHFDPTHPGAVSGLRPAETTAILPSLEALVPYLSK